MDVSPVGDVGGFAVGERFDHKAEGREGLVDLRSEFFTYL